MARPVSSWGGDAPVVQPGQEWQERPALSLVRRDPWGCRWEQRALGGDPVLAEERGFHRVVVAPHIRSPNTLNRGNPGSSVQSQEGLQPHPLCPSPPAESQVDWTHGGGPVLFLRMEAKYCWVAGRLRFLLRDRGPYSVSPHSQGVVGSRRQHEGHAWHRVSAQQRHLLYNSCHGACGSR